MPERRLSAFLIDAQPLVREGVAARLVREPDLCVVGQAATVPEALLSLRELPADFVIVEWVASAPGTPCLSDFVVTVAPAMVIVLSDQTHRTFVSSVVRAGARGYVHKRSPPERLAAILRAAAAGGVCIDTDVSGLLVDEDTQGLNCLTPREQQVLQGLGRGLMSKEIARELNIGVRTVESHRRNLKRRLMVDSAAGLIKFAVLHGNETRSA